MPCLQRYLPHANDSFHPRLQLPNCLPCIHFPHVFTITHTTNQPQAPNQIHFLFNYSIPISQKESPTRMSTCDDLTIVWSTMGIAVVVLIAHHWCEHGPRENRRGMVDPEDPYERCFQRRDVCNFRTFSHEMFIIPIWIVGFICGTIQWSRECVSWETSLVFGIAYNVEFWFVVCILSLQNRRNESELDDW